MNATTIISIPAKQITFKSEGKVIKAQAKLSTDKRYYLIIAGQYKNYLVPKRITK